MTTSTTKTTLSKDGPPEGWTLEQIWPFLCATLGIARSSGGKRPASSEGAMAASTAQNACSPADREAHDPVAGAALEHPENLDELERGQDQVEQPLRALRERETDEATAASTEGAPFEAPSQAGWAEERAPTPDEALSLPLGQALHSKSVLLVVDNFDPEHGNPEHVPSPGDQCPPLMTSRARPLAARLEAAKLELAVWTRREYLRDRCPRLAKKADAAVDWLPEFVARLPLGVRLLV